MTPFGQHAVTSAATIFLGCSGVWASTGSAANRQRSLDEWRALTGPSNIPPTVYVKGDNLRFFFQTTNGVEGFSADWSRVRVPAHNADGGRCE